MNIAVLGGTFDPPHIGHLLVARQVLEYCPNINEVWLLSANTNPEKKIYASPKYRLAMTQLLKEPGIAVSDIDISRGGETYTIDTVKALLKNSQHKFFWITGSDLISPMKKWRGYKEIVAIIPFIVFPRPEFPIESVEPTFIVLPKNKLLTTNYSSTAIRARVAAGLSISGLVPKAVADYIDKHKLYQQKKVYV